MTATRCQCGEPRIQLVNTDHEKANTYLAIDSIACPTCTETIAAMLEFPSPRLFPEAYAEPMRSWYLSQEQAS